MDILQRLVELASSTQDVIVKPALPDPFAGTSSLADLTLRKNFHTH